MECTIGLVSQLNNVGADFLASNHVDSAFDSFRNAMELVRVISDSQQDDHSCSLSSSEGAGVKEQKEAAAHLRQEVVGAPASESIAPSSPSSSPSSKEEDPIAPYYPPSSALCFEHSHFVYGRALVFNPSLLASASRQLDEYLPICAAMIQFNLALCYQWKAKDVGDQALIRALYWYDICLANVQVSVHTTMPDYMDVVVAAMNNMAIVSYDLCQYGRVRQIYQSLLQTITSYNIVANTLSNFQEEHMEQLMLNIILLHTDPIAPAA